MSGHSDLCLPWEADGRLVKDAKGSVLGYFLRRTLTEDVCEIVNCIAPPDEPPASEAVSRILDAHRGVKVPSTEDHRGVTMPAAEAATYMEEHPA